MEFWIDNREQKIKHACSLKNIEYTAHNLSLGDFIFTYNDIPLVIIERKTISDLASSIKSGRYREQKFRLLSNYPKEKIIYLIEGTIPGDLEDKQYGLKNKTYYTTLTNLILRDQIGVYQTSNLNETMQFLENLRNKILKSGNSFVSKTLNRTQQYTNALQIHSDKKKNITPKRCFMFQLNQIPGISNMVSETIGKKYTNMFVLCQEYDKLPEDKRPEMLCDLLCKLKNGKSRKIGKKASLKIYNYICNIEIIPNETSKDNTSEPSSSMNLLEKKK